MSVAPSPSNPRVRELVRRLDEAMGPPDDAGRCRGVKQVLEETFAAGTEFLDERFLVPNPARYARRLVYRDPDDRYTVLAMVWNVGQGTPLHDHAGIWCVECVYSGRIRVTSYNCFGGDPEHDIVQFKQETVVPAVGVSRARERRGRAGGDAPRLRRRDDPLPHLRAGRERLAASLPRAQLHGVTRGGQGLPGAVAGVRRS